MPEPHHPPAAGPAANHTPVVSKAIVVHQPWATLIALGIKTIETKPMPPNGPMRPAGVRGLPGLAIEPGERIAIVAGQQKADVMKVGTGPYRPLMDPDRPGMLTHPLAFGAVVCTVAVTDALPMHACAAAEPGEDDVPNTLWLEGGAGTGVIGLVHQAANLSETDMDDQLPLGDFLPGRWGWMLTTQQQCAPIPCKGKQGVFALPDDVAEQVNR